MDIIESIVQEHFEREIFEDPLERVLVRGEPHASLDSEGMASSELSHLEGKGEECLHVG